MIEKLLKYQEVDAKLKSVENEIASSEERKKYIVAKKFLEQAPDKLDKLDYRAGELTGIIEGFSKKYQELLESIKEYNGVIEQSEDIDEVNVYKKNANKLNDQIKDLKTNLNNLIDELSSIKSNFSQLKTQTISMQRQYTEFRQKYKELKDSKEDIRLKISLELEKLEKSIDKKLLESYKAKRDDKIFPIFYEVNGNRCRQCGMELSVAALNNLTRNKIIECENCRRLIYIKEE